MSELMVTCWLQDADGDGPMSVHSPSSSSSGGGGGEYERERKCADTTGTVLVPWAGHIQC